MKRGSRFLRGWAVLLKSCNGDRDESSRGSGSSSSRCSASADVKVDSGSVFLSSGVLGGSGAAPLFREAAVIEGGLVQRGWVCSGWMRRRKLRRRCTICSILTVGDHFRYLFAASRVFPAPRETTRNKEEGCRGDEQDRDLRPQVRDRFVAPENLRETVDRPCVDG